MSWSLDLSSTLNRRLMPLYVAAFFQGFVLWYAVEKLFMRVIGFDDAGIGAMVAAYSAIMLLVETPSGILADRWSRKGVLILASISLAISSVICGLSNGVAVYIVGAIFWGIFWALYSGTYDSIIYDTLLEENHSSKSFERYFGRIKLVDSIALVIGSLLGAVVGEVFGLRDTYYWSVPLALISIIALLRFREPQLHKAEVAVPIKEHTIETFKAVLQKGRLLPILIVLVLVTSLTLILFEFNQLWLIALTAPIVIYGPANALLLSTSGLGGLAAGYLKMNKRGMMTLTVAVMLLSSLGLVLFRATAAIVTSQVILGIGLVGITVIFTRLLHDDLPSKVRAGAASAASTLGTMICIPLSLGFGIVSEEKGVFNAAWIFFGMLIIVSTFVLKTLADNNNLSSLSTKDIVHIEQMKK